MAALPVSVALLLAALTAVVGRRRPAWASGLAIGGSTMVAGVLVVSLLARPAAVRIEWIAAWGWELRLHLDGLAALYGGLAAGMALLVLVYASAYVPTHREETGAPPRREAGFYAWMMLFLAAMLGLASAGDLVLLFVCFDLTALCSWALIGFDRGREARRAAATAFLVTAGASVPMLVGFVLLAVRAGTSDLQALTRGGHGPAAGVLPMALIAVGALAKSAQFPLHFWLPRAMVAPTPVSAYLHSASMVAAGVLVMHRLQPLFPPAVLLVVATLGWVSILIGSLLAATASGLKRILAYSTIAHYGPVMVMLALGGPRGAAAASVYLVAHALAKGALFLVAGAVTQATGERRLESVGGVGRRAPLLAAVAAVAAASLAGLPFTAGYFQDESFLKVLEGSGPAALAAGSVAIALTVAYIGRFWGGINLGVERGIDRVHALRGPRVATPAVLAVALAIGGAAGPWLARFGNAAAASVAENPPTFHLALRPELTPTVSGALAGWALGAVLLAISRWWAAPLARISRVVAARGPAALWDAGLAGLGSLADRLHLMEIRDLRDRLASVLVPAGLLVASAVLAGREDMSWSAGRIATASLPLLLAMAAVTVATAVTVRSATRLGLVLALTAVGFAMAGVFSLLGAPDVALAAVLVETALTLLLLAVIARLPRADREPRDGRAPPVRWHLAAAAIAGSVALAVVWAALSNPGAPTVAARLVELAPEAHAKNVVAAVLADFRGLDTLGEISVVVVALVAMRTFLQEQGR